VPHLQRQASIGSQIQFSLAVGTARSSCRARSLTLDQLQLAPAGNVGQSHRQAQVDRLLVEDQLALRSFQSRAHLAASFLQHRAQRGHWSWLGNMPLLCRYESGRSAHSAIIAIHGWCITIYTPGGPLKTMFSVVIVKMELPRCDEGPRRCTRLLADPLSQYPRAAVEVTVSINNICAFVQIYCLCA
jgi:hypothetical protein